MRAGGRVCRWHGWTDHAGRLVRRVAFVWGLSTTVVAASRHARAEDAPPLPPILRPEAAASSSPPPDAPAQGPSSADDSSPPLGEDPGTAAAIDENAPVRVTAHVEAAAVVPGRPFDVWVEVDRLATARYTLPDLGRSVRGLLVLDQRIGRDETVGDRVVRTDRWTLKAPKSGTYIIPGVDAPWTTEDGRVGTAGTAPVVIEAAHGGGNEETDTLHDIRGPVAPKRDLRIGVVFIVVITALFAAMVWWRRRGRPVAVVPPVSPEERLESRLRVLEGPAWLGADDAGPFAFALSEALRLWLEARFHFPAMEMTTDELLSALPEALRRDNRGPVALREVLEASDLVKFARAPVTDTQRRRWVEQVRLLVSFAPKVEERP